MQRGGYRSRLFPGIKDCPDQPRRGTDLEPLHPYEVALPPDVLSGAVIGQLSRQSLHRLTWPAAIIHAIAVRFLRTLHARLEILQARGIGKRGLARFNRRLVRFSALSFTLGPCDRWHREQQCKKQHHFLHETATSTLGYRGYPSEIPCFSL